MEEKKFEWDNTKNNSNLDKHGVDFIQAKDVFKDENKIETPDNRKDYGEQRFKIVGIAIDLILSVIYTIRGNVIRIISARAASKKERDDYYKNL
jgi:uncharacterized DUF497 family protein